MPSQRWGHRLRWIVFLLLCGGSIATMLIPDDQPAPQQTLFTAAGRGDVRETHRQLARGASVNAYSSVWGSPLSQAACYGHADIVVLLIAHGADVEVKNFAGNTPLWLAAISGQRDVVRLLVHAGADPDARCHNNTTPRTIAPEMFDSSGKTDCP